MNEDPSMDKRHFGVPPSKSLGQQDSNRPRQDGSGGSQNVNKSNYPRPPRRRESPSHASQSLLLSKNTRQENSTKPTPQKNKATMDKRPRARLSDSLQSIGEEEPEYGSIQKFGSKKQNLNHLLNFHFAPREMSRNNTGSWRAYNSHPGGGWRSRNSGGVVGPNARPKFNKENFLQANCQFLVKSTGDYEVYKYDPDILVDWNMIEQIYIRVTGEFPRCPICLDQPAAAKMVKCGHIFCWPCILHYLALSDKPVRKCPICYEPIHKQELKSVVAKKIEDLNVGDEIEMQLMFRSKTSFDAMPLMCKGGGASFDWESVFSKLLITTPEEVKKLVLDREESELQRRFREEEHCPEVCFVEQALRELDTRRSNLETSNETTQVVEQDEKLVSVLKAIHPDWLASPDSEPLTEQLIQQSFVMNPTQQQEFTTNENAGQKQRCDSEGSDSASACLNYNEDENATKVSDKEGHFYFYQGVGGQNVFLHPLCHAILSRSFGSDTANWPQIIQFRIVEKEYVIMTEELRKRLKFLQHLPITSNLQLVEVELKPPFISQELLQEFSPQLEARRKRRTQRIRDEKRREKVIREEEEKKLQNQTPQYKFESTLDFPEYRYEDYESVPATPNEEHCPLLISTISTDEESTLILDQAAGNSSSSFSTSPSGMSFAQIVSQKSASSFSSNPSGRGAWGKSAPSLNLEAKDSRSGSELDPDEYTSVPQYRMSMSDAIQKALANISVVEETEVAESNNNGNGKKKGRKKGKLLFNTGIGF